MNYWLYFDNSWGGFWHDFGSTYVIYHWLTNRPTQINVYGGTFNYNTSSYNGIFFGDDIYSPGAGYVERGFTKLSFT